MLFALEPEGSFLTLRVTGTLDLAVEKMLQQADALARTLCKIRKDGRFALPPRQLSEILRKLALVGKFTYGGRPLVMNLFSSVPLENGELLIRGERVPLALCEAVGRGSPPWCIYRSCFRFLEEGVEWDQLQPKKVVVHPESWPVLQLHDRHGAFADLFFDYGEERIACHDCRESVFRDREAEKQWERDLLESDFQKKQVGDSHYFCPLERVSKALTFLLEVGWTILDTKGRQVVRETGVTSEIQSEKGWVRVRGAVRYGEHETDLSAVVGAFNRRDRFVELEGDRVGLLTESSKVASLAEAEVTDDGLRLRRCHLGRLDDWLESEGVATDPTLRLSREVALNDRFRGQLRSYQQQGLEWLMALYDQGLNGLLADDMGLGKTVQVVAFLSLLPKEARHLIVAPTSLLFNWRKELERFLPDQEVTVHYGTVRDVDKLRGIVLTSYGTLRADSAQLMQVPFQCVILDEAQAIKNPESETARAASQLQSAFRVSLSGTPVENRSEELWSHFHFLMPELLGERAHFRARIQAAASDSRYSAQIRREIRPFLLRRTKEEVARDLPLKIEQLVEVEMAAEQRAAYERIMSQGRLVADEGSRMEVLELILRLRQMCCHPLLLGDEASPSAKMEVLLSDLDTLVAAGKKILVYSQFTSMLHLIGRQLTVPHVMLEGQTRNREEVVRQFQEDPEMPIFLISLKAGGTGLNLTAADSVLLYDPWWNEAVEQQAIDRAHRIGQDKTVIAKRYILVDSIEQKLMRLKAQKRKLGEQLVVTDSDLRALLI